ncbi:MAG TPA: PIG-L family deacetylase [Microthrixaceae bacterium]|nr:PIG-L family deacetylase [Microthrixaceae bacterium]RUP36235.1 MAG: GlcNAc-PI de-N-acetylase [Gordonia sp. (in: high G+C Gram-positive bacteria)]MCB9376598.1 PIG-L family deacetylase [Microthrixaceae bacterium]MCB9400133.1 PIG-L family deacetylase [Microthrixaceae bacterium]MCO5304779.1 PIG-L family deacetylase [Microthrixaceae bacterium]
MSTVVCFHAHPDDECIQTGGTMARAAADGHRVVLVVATRGEHGEVVPDVLADGEALWQRRIAETFEAAQILGVQRVEFLGYVDSGMMGDPANTAPYAFWSADVDAAARRLAAILSEESAEVLTAYDHHGGYGHPDHIQVHRVGLRAAELAGTPVVLQATMNRDHVLAGIAEAREAAEAAREVGDEVTTPLDAPDFDIPDDFGEPAANITHAIDVSDLVGAKRAAMVAHASQIAADSWFLAMDDEQFTRAFGTEWFIRTGGTRAEGVPFLESIWA